MVFVVVVVVVAVVVVAVVGLVVVVGFRGRGSVGRHVRGFMHIVANNGQKRQEDVHD